MINISIIGCGNIATMISEHSDVATIVAVYDKDINKTKEFAKRTGAHFCESVEKLLSHPCDLVLEAASPKVIEVIGEKVLRSKKDLMIMSVGGLADSKLLDKLLGMAKESGNKIYLPSGAIGGLDAISAARVGNIEKIMLETTKPPSSLNMAVHERTVVFEGGPTEAIKRFPRNINVSVTLSIIGGMDNVKVRIIVDPEVDHNIHNLKVTGDVGELTFNFDNVPSPNMATSLLAGYSAIALLKKINSPLQY